MLIHRTKTSTLLSLGLAGLAIRNVTQYLLDRSGTTTDAIDFGMGLLFGVSMTLLLVVAARLGRERRQAR